MAESNKAEKLPVNISTWKGVTMAYQNSETPTFILLCQHHSCAADTPFARAAIVAPQIRVPEGCDLVAVGALAVAFGTSHVALVHRANLTSGQVLVVLGAVGGVGLAAVQIEKACGAIVIAVARGAEKVQILKTLGVDHVIPANIALVKAGDPLYVLLCCWLAAVGAGLLKTEEILERVVRLRISNDIEFEEQNFIALMN
ncbi:Oxidoreductase family protein [Arachis hypogaea]|nr:Oxidoreductase family protein [Arachis hypogaea]